MGTQIAEIPDYLKKYMTQPSTEAESLASSSVSIPRISLRAKKFRFIEGGEEVEVVSDQIHMVILAVEPEPGRFIKTFYEGTYNSGDSSPPTCSSSDGIRPDSWVTTPQNDLCATCQMNKFGSATSRTGKKAKACRDSKRLWLVKPDNIEGTVYGLNVPVTSLKSLSEFGRVLKEQNTPVSAAIVRLSLDDDESYPILNFELAGWLNEKYGPLAIERNIAKNWTGAIKSSAPALAAPIQTTKQISAPVEVEIIQAAEKAKKSDPKAIDEAMKGWE